MPGYPSGAKSSWRNLFLSGSPEYSGLTSECPGGTSRACGAREEMGKRQIRISKDIKGTGLLTAVLRTSAESPPPSLWEILTQRCPHLSHSQSPHPHLPLLCGQLLMCAPKYRDKSRCQ